MLDMSDIKSFKSDWTNRRKVIKRMLFVLSVLLIASLVGATVLAYFAKFGLYVSIFYTVFSALTFIVILGIVGSYVFGASWETRDFLNILPSIIPDFDMTSRIEQVTPSEPDTSELNDSHSTEINT